MTDPTKTATRIEGGLAEAMGMGADAHREPAWHTKPPAVDRLCYVQFANRLTGLSMGPPTLFRHYRPGKLLDTTNGVAVEVSLCVGAEARFWWPVSEHRPKPFPFAPPCQPRVLVTHLAQRGDPEEVATCRDGAEELVAALRSSLFYVRDGGPSHHQANAIPTRADVEVRVIYSWVDHFSLVIETVRGASDSFSLPKGPDMGRHLAAEVLRLAAEAWVKGPEE